MNSIECRQRADAYGVRALHESGDSREKLLALADHWDALAERKDKLEGVELKPPQKGEQG